MVWIQQSKPMNYVVQRNVKKSNKQEGIKKSKLFIQYTSAQEYDYFQSKKLKFSREQLHGPSSRVLGKSLECPCVVSSTSSTSSEVDQPTKLK